MNALDVIDHIQRMLEGNPDVCLFVLKEETWMGRKMHYVKPGRAQTWLLGQQAGVTGPGFRGNDREYLKAISEIVCGMTQEEIRAIGTHQTRQNTLEAIEFNVYMQLFKRLMQELERLESVFGSTRSSVDAERAGLWSLPYVVEEIKRKATLNEKEYKSARERIAAAGAESETEEERKVAGVGLDIFADPNSIWGTGNGASEWRGLASKLQKLVDYVGALGVVFAHAPVADEEKEAARERKAERDYERGVQSIPRIRSGFNVSVPRLPRTSGESFGWSELRSALFKIFDSLPGTTKYRARYEEKKASMCCQIG
jgi:hypothetical protein